MLLLNQVSKTYISKKGLQIEALKSTNLHFSDKGLVVILGKSGSGKTTLLNLIGGLDKPTTGNISIYDHPIGDNLSLDDYRNQYIGFIFQDYNLLESETVYKNLEFPLLLQKKDDNITRIQEILYFVGLSGIENRYPNELSGGQKQRVAIARALVKSSSILLADEPTGNLDSDTSTQIFQLLKTISKEQLVIVVTHDQDFAKSYADRVIEIKDGVIIKDTLPVTIEPTNTIITSLPNVSFPWIYAIKMGFQNLLKKKTKTLLTLFIAALSIFMLTFSQILLMYSPEDALAETLYQNNVDIVKVYQNESEFVFGNSTYNYPINPKVYNEVLKGTIYIKQINGYGIIRSAQDLLDLGYDFYGHQEISDDSIIVTDYFLRLNKNFLKVSFDGIDYKRYNAEVMDYPYFVGKYVKLSYDTKIYHIAGIIKTDFMTYHNPDMTMKSEAGTDYDDPKIFKEYQSYNMENFYTIKYVTEGYLRKNDQLLLLNNTNNRSTINGEISYQLEDYKSVYIKTGHSDYTWFMSNNELSNYLPTLNPGDVYITMDLYNKIFNERLTFSSYIDFDPYDTTSSPIKFPEKIGQQITLNIRDKYTNNLMVEQSYTLKGVIMDYFGAGGSDYQIIMNQSDIEDNVHIDFLNSMTFVKLTGDVKMDSKLINNLRNEHNLIINHPYSIPLYDNEQFQLNLGETFLIFSAISTIITILIIINFVGYSIADQKHEIGILRSLGSKVIDIVKIYLFETLTVSLLIFLVTVFLSYSLVHFNNIEMSKNTFDNITFLMVEPLTIVVAFISSVITINVFALIPISKIGNMKPMDAIKAI